MPQQRPRLVNARRAVPVSRHMPGWDSIETVAATRGGFQLAGLVLLVLLGAMMAFAAWQLRSRQWPEWVDIGQYQLRSRFVEIGCAIALVLIVVCEAAAYTYGLRQTTLTDAAAQASADRIEHLLADAKARPVSDGSGSRYVKENSDLQQRLNEAETKLANLEKSETKRRLSPEQKRFLIDALRPFAGQKVSIASIRGDEESSALAQDFVAVLEAAGWDHHGKEGVTAQDWPRDPIGIEITLNEKDARSNEITPGTAALINAVRKLGMVYDNTVYMDNDVPPGQPLLKVGRKLQQ
jgi:hypothetical protein